MLEANYIRHFLVLGKLCKFYDEADSEATAHTLRHARLIDQVATGASASLPGSKIMAAHYAQIEAAITNGPTAMKAAAVSTASDYLRGSDFRNDFVEEDVPAATANAALTALALEMSAENDNVTLSTEADTGLINFFDTIAGEELTWNDSSDPDYPDDTYVTDDIVE